MQASFVAEEWVDHTLSKTRKAETKLEQSEKAHADSERRHKEALVHLAEVEKVRKNTKSTLVGFARNKPRRHGFL